MKMDPVVHFEMPYQDSGRLADFYSKVFGWQMTSLGEKMGNYVLATTTETDQNQMIKTPGNINGGFFEKTEAIKYPSVVIAVEDIVESTKKVKEAGGKVLGGSYKPGEPDDMPGIGLYSAFIDSEGNRVGMLQPAPRT